MNTQVKIMASGGLLLIVLAHALTLGIAMQPRASQMQFPNLPNATGQFESSNISVPDYPKISAPAGGVNLPALHEEKQGLFARQRSETKGQGVQQAGPCLPCQGQVYRPSVPQYSVPYVPSYVPAPIASPQPNTSILKPSKPLKLALFVDGSPKSQAVLNWFSTNPELAGLKQSCEYTVYSPNDTLYRQRYAHIVPVQAMPAILWSYQPDGDVNQKKAANIFATGGDLLQSDRQLVADMRQAYANHLQVRQAPVAQAITHPQSQFSLSQFAAPTLLLNQASYDQDCPGGQCDQRMPPSNDEQWHPFANRRPEVQGPFRDLASMSIETMAAVVIVIVAAAVGLTIVLMRK